MVAAGHRFFVRQQAFRNRRDKRHFLICHYNAYARAKEHFDVLADDPYRRLYCWEEEEDREKLRTAATQPEGFMIYTNTFVPDWEKQLTRPVKEKIKSYLKTLGWKGGKKESITPQFFPYFGEIYVSLRLKSGEVRVRWDEIER